MPGIVAAPPAIEGLWRDAKIAAGEAGIVPMGVVVIKPFQPLPGLPGQIRDASQASSTRYHTAINAHSAAIVQHSHTSGVTHLSERDQIRIHTR